jgi:hypothetical protein
MQEKMNRELKPIIQLKDTEYGSDHVRNLWARNIIDIYDIKAKMGDSIRLEKCSGRCKHPYSKPEVKSLLRHYKDAVWDRHMQSENQLKLIISVLD